MGFASAGRSIGLEASVAVVPTTGIHPRRKLNVRRGGQGASVQQISNQIEARINRIPRKTLKGDHTIFVTHSNRTPAATEPLGDQASPQPSDGDQRLSESGRGRDRGGEGAPSRERGNPGVLIFIASKVNLKTLSM